jgi:omega-6 fatty acid desaturase (delta-12 desaturase)
MFPENHCRILNYNLEACHRSDPLFRDVKAVTLLASMRSFTLRLWDESNKKLVGFKHLRDLRRQRRRARPRPDDPDGHRAPPRSSHESLHDTD